MPKDILINGASPVKIIIAASLYNKNLTPASRKRDKLSKGEEPDFNDFKQL